MNTQVSNYKLNTYLSKSVSDYVNFGFKGQKFAKFMVELVAEFGVNASAYVSPDILHLMIYDYGLVRDYITQLFIDTENKSYGPISDKLFLNENHEVCMFIDKNNDIYKKLDNLGLNFNPTIKTHISNTIDHLGKCYPTILYIDKLINTLGLLDNPNPKQRIRIHVPFDKLHEYYVLLDPNNPYVPYVKTLLKSKASVKKPVLNGTHVYIVRKCIDKSTKRESWNLCNNFIYNMEYKELYKDYWNPSSECQFLHTSFTCRDAYLIALLLSGTPNNEIEKLGYSKKEIDEMIGVDRSLIELEAVKAIIDNLDQINDKIYKACQKELSNIKDEFDVKINELTQQKYRMLLNTIMTHHSLFQKNIENALSTDIEDFFYPDKFMCVYNNMIKELSEAIANG